MRSFCFFPGLYFKLTWWSLAANSVIIVRKFPFQYHYSPLSLQYCEDQHQKLVLIHLVDRQALLTIGQLMAFNATIRVRNQSSFAYHPRKCGELTVAVYVAQNNSFQNP